MNRFIKGYRVIDIPISSSGGACHSIYIKVHSGGRNLESENNVIGNTLFVGNVDYADYLSHNDISEFLSLLFSRFGDIRSVRVSSFVESQSANTRFAHVEFTKKSAVKVALSASERDYIDAGKAVYSEWGSKYYQQFESHLKNREIKDKFPFVDEDPEELKEDADTFMADYEENELIEKQEREKKLNEVDEDGFMPVKNRSKRKRAVEAKRGNSISRDRTNKKKKKQVELKNFYVHQIRQERILKLDNLRKKFEEDKDRVAKMKDARKFKPF